jgi:hypothetical protein
MLDNASQFSEGEMTMAQRHQRGWLKKEKRWLMRFFAAAMARRSKEAIRRASASMKPSSSASGSERDANFEKRWPALLGTLLET